MIEPTGAETPTPADGTTRAAATDSAVAETAGDAAAPASGPTWQTIPAAEVRVGDRIRPRGIEIEVSRIDVGFLGRPGFLAFIEDRPDRWIKIPSPPDAEVEVLR